MAHSRAPRRGVDGAACPRERRGPSALPLLALLLALVVVAYVPARAGEPSGHEIVERVESLMWGKTVQGEYEMTITTPRWERTLVLRAWMERPKRSFVRILAPAKEKGIGSLRIGAEMWNYLPNVERTIKIPPSMMLQPWMGSDFTNDDLVKASSIVDDYTSRVLREEPAGGAPAYVLELIPKPDAAVVWGKIVYWVRKSDFIPLKEEFYDERGGLIRTMTFSEVRPMGGRTIPTRWEIRPTEKPANSTTLVVKSALYDRPIDPEVFTQRNLQKP
ncbi:MAG TPA: outer membrane lipoprotein-sorting protein [Casimicrobiaceae bacterium]